jgi:hypothetical protein
MGTTVKFNLLKMTITNYNRRPRRPHYDRDEELAEKFRQDRITKREKEERRRQKWRERNEKGPHLRALANTYKATEEALRDAKLGREKYGHEFYDIQLKRLRLGKPSFDPELYEKYLLEEGELLKRRKHV